MYAIRQTSAEQDAVIPQLLAAGLPSIRLDIHGVRLHIQSNVVDTIDAVREGYAYFERDASEFRGGAKIHHVLSLSSEGSGYDEYAAALFADSPWPPHCLVCPDYRRIYCYASHGSLHYAVGSFFTALMEAMLYDDFLIVHGAAVVGETGIIFPGALRCGKTTLTLSLIYEGYGFATDDIVLVRRDTLAVHPYPRLLNLRQESLYLVRGVHRDYDKMSYSESFGEPRWFLSKSDCAAPPFGCNYIVFPKIMGGESKLVPLSKADAALRIIQQSFHPMTPIKRVTDTGGNLPTLSRLLADAECFELQQGAPEDSLRLLRSLLRSPRVARRGAARTG